MQTIAPMLYVLWKHQDPKINYLLFQIRWVKFRGLMAMVGMILEIFVSNLPLNTQELWLGAFGRPDCREQLFLKAYLRQRI